MSHASISITSSSAVTVSDWPKRNRVSIALLEVEVKNQPFSTRSSAESSYSIILVFTVLNLDVPQESIQVPVSFIIDDPVIDEDVLFVWEVTAIDDSEGEYSTVCNDSFVHKFEFCYLLKQCYTLNISINIGIFFLAFNTRIIKCPKKDKIQSFIQICAYIF